MRLPPTLATLAIIAILLLLIFRLPTVLDRAYLALGGHSLQQALLLRSAIGDLSLGPETPPIWALARAAPAQSPASALVVERVAVGERLNEAVARLQRAGRGKRLLGVALGSQGDYPQAQQALGLAGQTEPRDSLARLALGNVQDEQGQRQAAIATWQAVEADQAISYQLYRQGTRLANQGDRSQGERMLQEAIAVNPGYADPYHALGGFYWGQDQEKAVEMYRRSLAVGGLEPFFERLAQGKIALAEGQSQPAVTALQEAVRLRPDHAGAHQFLGAALLQAGRSQEALDVFHRAAELAPDSFWPWLQIGQIHLDQGQYDQAIDALTQAVERRVTQPLAFVLLAQAYMGVERPDRAAVAWQQAVVLSPDNVGYRLRLGDTLQQAGQPEQAIAAYQAALELEADNDHALRQLERLTAQQEQGP